MKLLSIISAFSIVSISASAQTTSEHLERFAQSLLARQGSSPVTGILSTPGKQRLIMSAAYDHLAGLDTSRYAYTGSHSSWFDFSYMNYPQFYEADYPVFYPYSMVMVHILADRVTHTHTKPDGTLARYRPQLFSYTDAGKINGNRLYYYRDGTSADALVTADSDKYTYNSEGKLVEHYDMNLDEGKWQNATRSAYVYDAEGQLVTDSVYYFVPGGGWEAARLVHYAYDGNGMLTSAQSSVFMNDEWKNGEGYEMSYYPDQRLKTISVKGALQLRDSFGYAEGGQVQCRYRSSSYGGRNWDLQQAYINRLDAATATGAPSKTYELVPAYKTMDTAHIITYTYNAYGNPEKKIVYAGDGRTEEAHTYYYYQLYDVQPRNTTSNINTTATTTTTRVAPMARTVIVKLYPDPAKDEVFIECSAAYKHATVTIYSTQGSQVFISNYDGDARIQVSVGNLAPGMYYYKVAFDDDKTASGKFMVQR